MATLTRDMILAIQDRNMKKIHIKAWGGDVYIKQLSGEEQDKFEQDSFMSKDKSVVGVRARLVSIAICDADGNKMFKPDDIKALQAKSSAVLNQLYDEIIALNRISDEDIEEIAKN